MAVDELLRRAREAWLGSEQGDIAWPESGVAIEGDFAGIQNYVLKPVPGAKGAAKRLRGRSLQVSALTELIANETLLRFLKAQLYYSAGGRFLLFAALTNDWRERLTRLQAEIDQWIGRQFRGEVAFHLVGVEFQNRLIPSKELEQKMAEGKNRPLMHFLQNADGWMEQNFLRAPKEKANPFVCPACLVTADDGRDQPDENNEKICDECDRDKKLGTKLARSRRALVSEVAQGEICFLNRSYTVGDTGTASANVIHHMPRDQGEPVALEDVAERSIGNRKFLAYLRIDADGMGNRFRALKQPSQIRGLSRFLQLFFCDRVQELITKPAPGHDQVRYSWLYPVYGGGDDLFVIGPWNMVLDFAVELEARFTEHSKGKLTFSAGVSLSKPKEHILSKSEEASIALNERAKRRPGKSAIHVFGETFSWREFPGVLRKAQKLTDLHQRGLVSSQLLQLLISLHGEWRQAPEGDAARVRYKPMLHYQIERNLNQAEAKKGIAEILGRGSEQGEVGWPTAGFMARYAMLAARKRNQGENNE